MTIATETISNGQDVIDSRDVIARIEFLQGYVQCLKCHSMLEWDTETPSPNWVEQGGPDETSAVCPVDQGEHDPDSDGEELLALLALQEEAQGSPDWPYGEALIRDSYFTKYAQELAEDIGAINADLKWPYTSIDWDDAAADLKADYFSVTFDGVEYWIRS